MGPPGCIRSVGLTSLMHGGFTNSPHCEFIGRLETITIVFFLFLSITYRFSFSSLNFS